ncbi:hypothetical protein PGH12_00080 [Chryseobacterium wangxinyae]|uniref:hypothetical protein n=1 Tax=Chryseobacterium sp. CY350 TaxID=2997336 RepID=UPI00226D7A01|nr:hypothetical protein [Chryseobacterium sp. CY350]MCY0977427.1 hypothetical protein [Chryseobacterium sp. CY350]WBZ95556.1 hypothetical protein PGH12_00080 [Chryseobacterium sp. CY350]
MVKRNVLSKLSNKELENYLNPENRFVPEAVQMASEILEERGRVFTEAEKINIQNIIQHKKETEAAKKDEETEDWKDHITNDPSAVKLYSRTLILVSSFFLGTFFGAVLLSLNFLKLKKYVPAVFTFVFGMIYVPLQYFVYNFLIENHLATTSRYSLENLPIIAGPLILIVIWVTTMPKRIVYRPQSFLFPIIFAAFMLFLIFNNYYGLFSSYFLMRFSE